MYDNHGTKLFTKSNSLHNKLLKPLDYSLTVKYQWPKYLTSFTQELKKKGYKMLGGGYVLP